MPSHPILVALAQNLGWNIDKGGGGGRKDLPIEVIVALVAHGFDPIEAFNYIRNVKKIKIRWTSFKSIVYEHFKSDLDGTGFESGAWYGHEKDIRKYWLNAQMSYLKPILEVYLKAGFSPASIKSKLVGFQYSFIKENSVESRYNRLIHKIFSESHRFLQKEYLKTEIIRLIIKGYNFPEILEFYPTITERRMKSQFLRLFGLDLKAPRYYQRIINAWRALILPRLQFYLERQYSDQQICEEFEWDSITTSYPYRTLSDPHEIVSYFVNALFPGLENSEHARFVLRANLLSSVKWNLKWGDYGWYEP